MAIQKDRIKFNVGGKIFETTATTLAIAGRQSYFGAMFDENSDLRMNPDSEHFIDRSPYCFSILLDLLRTGELYIPANVPEKLLYREALFYGLADHVRSAKWGRFDGNHVQPSKSITGWAPGGGTAIRASPDGGCCVAHGSMVHIYDWMLEERCPINLDYQRVKDVGWVGSVDPTGLVVSTCQRLGRDQGAIGLFNSTTGELKYRFNAMHEGVVKSYTAGALTFNDRCNMFSCCKGKSKSQEDGIGVWDINTGQQVDFFYEPSGWSLGDADKLQWSSGLNCLLAATFYPRKDYPNICCLDFRAKSMDWYCSVVRFPFISDEVRVQDAIFMEDNRSICVVNKLAELGFIDLRSDKISWRSRPMELEMPNEPCYPKIALHEGQLFLSTNDCISVFSGSDSVLTSTLRRSFGGSICDFSIGGDRLFALHNKENVFDIWETPPSCIG